MEQVATIMYYEYLANGLVSIGTRAYDQDWNIILPILGYDRDQYTYRTEFISDESVESDVEFITKNNLRIFKKEK